MGRKARKEHGVSAPGSACRVGGWETRTKDRNRRGWVGTHPGQTATQPRPTLVCRSPPSPPLAGHTHTRVLTLTQGTLMLTHLHACPHSHTHVHSHLQAHTCSHIYSHLHTYTHTQSHTCSHRCSSTSLNHLISAYC